MHTMNDKYKLYNNLMALGITGSVGVKISIIVSRYVFI